MISVVVSHVVAVVVAVTVVVVVVAAVTVVVIVTVAVVVVAMVVISIHCKEQQTINSSPRQKSTKSVNPCYSHDTITPFHMISRVSLHQGNLLHTLSLVSYNTLSLIVRSHTLFILLMFVLPLLTSVIVSTH